MSHWQLQVPMIQAPTVRNLHGRVLRLRGVEERSAQGGSHARPGRARSCGWQRCQGTSPGDLMAGLSAGLRICVYIYIYIYACAHVDRIHTYGHIYIYVLTYIYVYYLYTIYICSLQEEEVTRATMRVRDHVLWTRHTLSVFLPELLILHLASRQVLARMDDTTCIWSPRAALMP